MKVMMMKKVKKRMLKRTVALKR